MNIETGLNHSYAWIEIWLFDYCTSTYLNTHSFLLTYWVEVRPRILNSSSSRNSFIANIESETKWKSKLNCRFRRVFGHWNWPEMNFVILNKFIIYRAAHDTQHNDDTTNLNDLSLWYMLIFFKKIFYFHFIFNSIYRIFDFYTAIHNF